MVLEWGGMVLEWGGMVLEWGEMVLEWGELGWNGVEWGWGCSLPNIMTLPGDASITSHDMPYDTDDTVTFTCYDGYSLIGPSELTCQSNGGWDPDIPYTPTCQRQCNDPESPENGGHDGSYPYTSYTTVNFNCNTGYTMVGSSSRTCTNGMWDGANPSCRLACGQVTPPTHGEVSPNPRDGYYEAGTIVTFHCDDGYTVSPRSEITCSTFGNWSDPQPRCLSPCYNYDIDNGITTINDPNDKYTSGDDVVYIHGSIITMSCDNGYTLYGLTMSQCNDGAWTQTASHCKGIAVQFA
ncbi:P-selectin-like [Saccoglossus kowalevskii]